MLVRCVNNGSEFETGLRICTGVSVLLRMLGETPFLHVLERIMDQAAKLAKVRSYGVAVNWCEGYTYKGNANSNLNVI